MDGGICKTPKFFIQGNLYKLFPYRRIRKGCHNSESFGPPPVDLIRSPSEFPQGYQKRPVAGDWRQQPADKKFKITLIEA